MGSLVGDDRAGAPGPGPTAPPLEKGRIMLDKFRRTGPASLGLGILLLLLDCSSELTAGTAPWGLCWEKSCPHPHPHPCLKCTQMYIPTLPWWSLPGSTWGSSPNSISPSGALSHHSLWSGGQTELHHPKPAPCLELVSHY